MKNILITVRPWEKRVAIVNEGLLQSIYFDSKCSGQLERSFFKGKVAKVLPGIQTAFVDIGQEKAGFLHISEIDRDSVFQKKNGANEIFEREDGEEEKPRRMGKRANIADLFKEGEHALVQVSKEPINLKGAKLTTCFMFPGRFVVFMPTVPKLGISKKIKSSAERARLKEIAHHVLPKGAGCILRTICEGKDEKEIEQDILYLVEIWNTIQKKYQEAASESCIYRDINMVLQIIRDYFDDSVERIICDDQVVYQEIFNFMKNMLPESIQKLQLHTERKPLFDEYNIEKQLESALKKKVDLPSGGSIVIDIAEAMTVIDVNTARYVGGGCAEDTILNTNMEAAKEIVRQVMLRNIGGLVVIDFIDMNSKVHNNKLSTFFEQTLHEKDRSQSTLLKISEFGVVQMTRKRTGKALWQQLLEPCTHCNGMGKIKSFAAKIYELFRLLDYEIVSGKHSGAKGCLIITSPVIADYLINIEYEVLLAIEKKYKMQVVVRVDESFYQEYKLEFFS